MTPEEKQAKLDLRNAAVCDYYLAGHKLSECAKHFELGRQRVLQILKQREVWVPYVRTKRTKFLGVSIKPAAKKALKRKASEKGISVSKLVSDAVDDLVKS